MIKVFCTCLLIIPLYVSAEGWVVTVVDPSGRPFVSLAVDGASHPHIAYNSYTDKAYHLTYARHDSSGWVIETVDTAGDIRYVSLSLDNSGGSHVAYYHGDNGDLRYARRDSADWIIESIDTIGIVGQYVSIGVNSAGCPGVSYYDETSGDLKYAEWDGNDWLIERVDTTGNVGRHTAFAFDKADNPRISYYDVTNYCLKYARKDGVEWFVTVVDTPAHVYERVGLYVSLALDTLGYPHVTYHYYELFGVFDNGVRYAKWDGAEWLVQLVEWGYGGDSMVGWGTSIALDSRDYPRVAYKRIAASDIPPHDLRCAEWNGTEWEVGTVDSFPDPEGQASLSLDVTGQPHLAYRTSCLKYANRPTNVEEDRTLHISPEVVLHRNYPNPFSEFTNICFWMSEHSITDPGPELEIFDASGRSLRSFRVRPCLRGLNLLKWDGRNGLGQPVADGVYFCRLRIGEISLTRKMVVLR